jgi:hypothetical protein
MHGRWWVNDPDCKHLVLYCTVLSNLVMSYIAVAVFISIDLTCLDSFLIDFLYDNYSQTTTKHKKRSFAQRRHQFQSRWDYRHRHCKGKEREREHYLLTYSEPAIYDADFKQPLLLYSSGDVWRRLHRIRRPFLRLQAEIAHCPAGLLNCPLPITHCLLSISS